MDTGAEQLPGLRVRDRIYTAATDFSDWNLLRGSLGKLDIWRVIDDHRLAGDHFLETSVPIAGGEVVTTVLLRASLKGRCLSLEAATCALTRTPSAYHRIGFHGEHGWGAVLRSAMRSIADVPLDVLRIWRLVEVPVILGRAWWAIKDRTLVPRRGRSIATRVAVREETADAWKNAQLDKHAIYEHMKIIEQRIIRATEDFLEDHEVDTSMFKKQATNIINSGVLNMGDMSISQAAIGTNAQGNFNTGTDGESA